MGRPSEYSEEAADRICHLIASTPRGLDHICNGDDSLPCARTVHRWLGLNDEFSQRYVRARELQADLLFDQCIEIADTQEVGEIVTKDGDKTTIKREDMLGHRKLQVETRFRMAGKLAPKKYGEKAEFDLTGRVVFNAAPLDDQL